MGAKRIVLKIPRNRLSLCISWSKYASSVDFCGLYQNFSWNIFMDKFFWYKDAHIRYL